MRKHGKTSYEVRAPENGQSRIWSEISPTGERPRSALNLRMALAIFGLVVCGVFAVLAGTAGLTWLAVVMAVLALVALVDLVVVARRRHRRGDGHTLFE
ncbi:DUF6343 family protein [Streptosporangium saharense]|uniref:Flp pilus assembly protein TadB n=1 Tax=Streptosporangium saharense TaxID=1706840 RepID=A0A7W7QMJ4_9ACTN|nr:DUF6343 family protein [Streptosporangium saharense]MBB4916345.1 Flp pilus assembly protein TadB [Streptosporangium saharense]